MSKEYLAKVTRRTQQGRDMAYISYELYTGASMPKRMLDDVPAKDRFEFEAELESAMIAVFDKFKNLDPSKSDMREMIDIVQEETPDYSNQGRFDELNDGGEEDWDGHSSGR